MKIDEKNKNLRSVNIPPNCTSVNLNGNKLTSFQDFPPIMPLVEKILVDSNLISSLDAFPICPSLTHLSLSHNLVQGDLSGFLEQLQENSPEIQAVSCNYNQLTCVTIPNIPNLHFHHNLINKLIFPEQIEDDSISEMEAMMLTVRYSVSYCNLSYNQITHFQNLPHMPNLTNLVLHHNPVSTLKDMPKGLVNQVLEFLNEDNLHHFNFSGMELRLLNDFIQSSDLGDRWDLANAFYRK